MEKTSEERREVAERLRKAHGIMKFVDALGIDFDSDWCWTDVSKRVADLIDPTCHKVIPDETEGYVSGRTVSAVGDWLVVADEYTCCDCRWWSVAEYEKEPTTELTCGYCRRFPPSCRILGEDDGHGQRMMGHPLCYAGDDVCGEFTPRDGERL